MEAVITILNLILLAVVVFIFWRLHSVLGTGGDRNSNRNPKHKMGASPKKAKPAKTAKTAKKRPKLRLVGKETKPTPQAPAAPPHADIDASADLPAHIIDGLDAIAAQDKQFNLANFLKGVAQAYPIILLAYASHDRTKLKPLVSQDVFDGFDAAMQAREAAGHSLETNIIELAAPHIHEAEFENGLARITVRIEAELASVLSDADGQQLQGDARAGIKTVDLWTFERAIHSKSPIWVLVATESI